MRIFLNHFFFIIICVNLFFLSLYENKLVYEFYHLKQIFYDQKTIMIFSWFRMFQVYVFALNSSHFVYEYFFIKQSVFKFLKLSRNIYSFCCIRFYIFGFNPTNSLIIFTSDSSFILPITILLALSKNFESSG